MQHTRTSRSNLEQRLEVIDPADPTIPSKAKALRALGNVVYFMRAPSGCIKIGYTTNLARRLAELPGSTVLAWMPGTPAIEASMHSRLGKHLAYGNEYYHPTPEILAEVDYARRYLGLDPIG